MAIKAVCFDFGGVLVRTADQTRRIAWENKLGLPPGGLSKIIFDSDISIKASLGEVPEPMVWEYVSLRLGISPGETDDLRKDFFKDDYLDTELVDFLKSLRPAYKTAILSNAWSNARKLFSDNFNLDRIVDQFIISAEVKLAKPDSAFFKKACLLLEVQPADMVFIDDFKDNVEGARSIGIKAYHFKNTDQVLLELKKVL